MKSIIKKAAAMSCALVMMTCMAISASATTVTYRIGRYNMECGAWKESKNLIGVSSAVNSKNAGVCVTGIAKCQKKVNGKRYVYTKHASNGNSSGITVYLSKPSNCTWINSSLKTTHVAANKSKTITGTTWHSLGVL